MAAAMEAAGTGMVVAATGRRAATEEAMGAREAAAMAAAVEAAISTWDLAVTSDPEAGQAGREGQEVLAGPGDQGGPGVRAAAAEEKT